MHLQLPPVIDDTRKELDYIRALLDFQTVSLPLSEIACQLYDQRRRMSHIIIFSASHAFGRTMPCQPEELPSLIQKEIGVVFSPTTITPNPGLGDILSLSQQSGQPLRQRDWLNDLTTSHKSSQSEVHQPSHDDRDYILQFIAE